MSTDATTTKPADPTKVRTGEFRLSFAHLFEPKTMEGQDGPPKYSLTMLFPKTADLSALKAAAAAACEKKWGADRNKWPKGMRSPFRDGDEKDYDGYAGMIFIAASSATKPGVVNQSVKPVTDPAEVFAGCYCRATVQAFAYDKAGNKGVGFSLHNVQKLRDGEPFGSKRAATDDFDAVARPVGAAAQGATGFDDSTF
jgi:hypothetical protein